MRWLTLAIALAIASLASAGDSLRSIPESVPRDEVIDLRAEDGDSWVWIIRRLPDGFRPKVVIVESGQRAIWSAPPGRYDIDLIVSSGGQLQQEFAQLTVTDTPVPVPPGPGPDPGPEPGPDPGPDPEPVHACDDVPPDAFGSIGQAACRALAAVTPEDLEFRDQVKAAYVATADAMDNPGESGVFSLKDAVAFRDRLLKPILDSAPSWREWGARVNAHADQFVSDVDRLNFGVMCRYLAEGL